MKQFHRHTLCVIRQVERVDTKVRHSRTVFSVSISHLTYYMGVVRMPSWASGELESGREGSSLPGNTAGHLPRSTEGQKATAWRTSFFPVTRPCESHLLFQKALVRPQPTCLLAVFTMVTLLGSSEPGNDIPKNVLMNWSSSFRAPQNCISILCLQKDVSILSLNSPCQQNLPWALALHFFSFKYRRLGTRTIIPPSFWQSTSG